MGKREGNTAYMHTVLTLSASEHRLKVVGTYLLASVRISRILDVTVMVLERRLLVSRRRERSRPGEFSRPDECSMEGIAKRVVEMVKIVGEVVYSKR